MQINHRPSHLKKPFVISVGVLAVLLIIGFSYFYVLKASLLGWSPLSKQAVDSSDNNPPSEEQIKSGQDIKKQSLENGSSGSDQPLAPTQNENSKSTVEVAFTAINQISTSLQVRTLIYGIESTGTCTLKLSKSGSSSVTKTASTQNLSNTSTCMGFDIPLSELTPGSWEASLTYSSNTLQGSTIKLITVN